LAEFLLRFKTMNLNRKGAHFVIGQTGKILYVTPANCTIGEVRNHLDLQPPPLQVRTYQRWGNDFTNPLKDSTIVQSHLSVYRDPAIAVELQATPPKNTSSFLDFVGDIKTQIQAAFSPKENTTSKKKDNQQSSSVLPVLPEEIWPTILSYMSFKELALSPFRVSKKFLDYSKRTVTR
jgi:hypothetical protein